MTTKTKNQKVKPSIVIFEHTDVPNTLHNESVYATKFMDFLTSLGYEVVEGGRFLSEVIIKGVTFKLDLNNTAPDSKNAFTREWTVRKPELRFIRLMPTTHGAQSVIKIQFNKEYDANKLRAKIDAHIEKIESAKNFWANKEQVDETNTVKVAKHFCKLINISSNIDNVHINKGVVTLSLSGPTTSSIDFNIDGSFNGFFSSQGDIKTKEGIVEFFEKQKKEQETVQQILLGADLLEPISLEIQEWSKTAYRKNYNTVTNEYSK